MPTVTASAVRPTATGSPDGPADDSLPALIAGQIDGVHRTVTAVTGRETLARRNPDEVPREVLRLLDGTEGLLTEKVLNCAVRPSE